LLRRVSMVRVNAGAGGVDGDFSACVGRGSLRDSSLSE
jgi:hypothetical protein